MAKRNNHPDARKKNNRQVKPTILIVCEDSDNSVRYLKDLDSHYRKTSKIEDVNVTGKCGSNPNSVINEGKAMVGDKNEPCYDYVFYLIDKDQHPEYNPAVSNFFSNKQAKNKKKPPAECHLLACVPSFEIFYVLHLSFCNKPLEHGDVYKHFFDKLKQKAQNDDSFRQSSLYKTAIKFESNEGEKRRKTFLKPSRRRGSHKLFDLFKEYLPDAIKNIFELTAYNSKQSPTQKERYLNCNPVCEMQNLLGLLITGQAEATQDQIIEKLRL